MRKVVSNATPIISLASVDKLSILKDIFGKIYVPKAVYNEIQTGQYPGHKDLEKDFFEIIEVKVIGTLTVLLMAKNSGLIQEIKPILDEMIQKGRWYSQKVYDYFLSSIGEL